MLDNLKAATQTKSYGINEEDYEYLLTNINHCLAWVSDIKEVSDVTPYLAWFESSDYINNLINELIIKIERGQWSFVINTIKQYINKHLCGAIYVPMFYKMLMLKLLNKVLNISSFISYLGTERKRETHLILNGFYRLGVFIYDEVFNKYEEYNENIKSYYKQLDEDISDDFLLTQAFVITADVQLKSIEDTIKEFEDDIIEANGESGLLDDMNYTIDVMTTLQLNHAMLYESTNKCASIFYNSIIDLKRSNITGVKRISY